MPDSRNTQFSLAVHLLILLSWAQPGSVVDSGELAGIAATNPAFVRRVLGRLRDAGLVSSRLGAHGGWSLTREAREINLAEVWLAVNGDTPLLGFHRPDPTRTSGKRVVANLRALDRRVRQLLLDELAGQTLVDLLQDAGTTPERGTPSRTDN